LEYVAAHVALIPGCPEHTLSKKECEVITRKEYLEGLSSHDNMNRVTDQMRNTAKVREKEPMKLSNLIMLSNTEQILTALNLAVLTHVYTCRKNR